MQKQVTIEHSLIFKPEDLEEEGAFLEALRGALCEVRSVHPQLQGYRLIDIGFLPRSDVIFLRFYFAEEI
ncbi:MAG: hypothetical protein ACOYBM_02890 [Dethiobacteria bacterium]|jgi:hypothetical protein|nr:hypothetical protein [Alcaligenaceae bacterium]NLC51142.1 hypothetical protein [Bacillota bacterium]